MHFILILSILFLNQTNVDCIYICVINCCSNSYFFLSHNIFLSHILTFLLKRIFTHKYVPATPWITPTGKDGSALLWCKGLLPIAKSGICTMWKTNWIRLAMTAYCSITRSHLQRPLWVKNFYSCKIMTQRILVNKDWYLYLKIPTF